MRKLDLRSMCCRCRHLNQLISALFTNVFTFHLWMQRGNKNKIISFLSLYVLDKCLKVNDVKMTETLHHCHLVVHCGICNSSSDQQVAAAHLHISTLIYTHCRLQTGSTGYRRTQTQDNVLLIMLLFQNLMQKVTCSADRCTFADEEEQLIKETEM